METPNLNAPQTPPVAPQDLENLPGGPVAPPASFAPPVAPQDAPWVQNGSIEMPPQGIVMDPYAPPVPAPQATAYVPTAAPAPQLELPPVPPTLTPAQMYVEATAKADQPTSFADLVKDRDIGRFYLGDDTPAYLRLAQILPQFGEAANLTDPDVLKAIISSWYTDMESMGRSVRLRRVTRTALDELKKLAKRLDGRVNPETKRFEEPIDEQDLAYLRVAYAVVEPAIPGTALRDKADWVRDYLTDDETDELLALSKQMDKFNLSRIREKVKN